MTLIDDKKIIVDAAQEKVAAKYDALVSQIKPILYEIRKSYIDLCVANNKKNKKIAADMVKQLKKNTNFSKAINSTNVVIKDEFPNLPIYDMPSRFDLWKLDIFNQYGGSIYNKHFHAWLELQTGSGSNNQFPKGIPPKIQQGIADVNNCVMKVRMTDAQYKKLSKPLNELTKLIDTFNAFQKEVALTGVDSELKTKLDDFLKKVK